MGVAHYLSYGQNLQWGVSDRRHRIRHSFGAFYSPLRSVSELDDQFVRRSEGAFPDMRGNDGLTLGSRRMRGSALGATRYASNILPSCHRPLIPDDTAERWRRH